MKMYTRPEIQVVSCKTETIMLSGIASAIGKQGGNDGDPISSFTVNFN